MASPECATIIAAAEPDMNAMMANQEANDLFTCGMGASDEPCVQETMDCMGDATCAALLTAEDETGVMGNSLGLALFECHANTDPCGGEMLNCMGDETCAAIFEAVDAVTPEDQYPDAAVLVSSGWCVKP